MQRAANEMRIRDWSSDVCSSGLQLRGWMRKLRQLRGGGMVPKEFVALGHLLHDLRLYKSGAELKLMRASAAIAVDAHLAALQVARPGSHEYEVEAELLHMMRSRGAVPAFSPIDRKSTRLNSSH